MNEALIEHLKELLRRVEACPFNLQSHGFDIDVHMYGTGNQSKAIAESICDFKTVDYHQAANEDFAWHKGRIGELIEVTTFTDLVDVAPVAEPQVQEAVQ